MVQSEFNEATRTMLFNNSSPLIHCSAIFENICWTQAAYALLCQPHHKDTSSMFVYALIWKCCRRRIVVVQLTQKSVCCLCLKQMEYFDDVFHTFLDLNSVIYLAVNGSQVSRFSCFPKMNEAFTGLERHGGKWLMTKCSFWGGVTL